ncbi:MAG: hypothetical protein E7172_01615 [Firmicutes bacterium]|nr:hypothetical protein [Bacillota bacterium]
MFGLISTKDLYLLSLQKVEKIDREVLGETKIYYRNEKIYVFGRKVLGNFIDVFNETEYFNVTHVGKLKIGMFAVTDAVPVLAEFKYVPKNILLEKLQKLNPCIFKSSERKLKID